MVCRKFYCIHVLQEDGRMKQYAYIRVSSKDQNVDRQFAALEPYKIPPKQIYCDRQSGRDFERPAYQKLIRRLRKGDLLIVKSIDRLGRNYNEILEQWALITKKIGADLVLQILAYVAQTEREFIRQRQAEGIAAARARGVRFGRRPDALPQRFEEACRLYASGQLSVRKAAKELGMSKSSFYRKCRRFLDAFEAESGEKSDERDKNPLSRQGHEAKQNENLSKIIIPTGRL